jgi:hypothetical protein
MAMMFLRSYSFFAGAPLAMAGARIRRVRV